MSNKCIKCLRRMAHDDEVCPKNVECSAKAMEAIGSSRIILCLFESGDCVVVEYVSDDDSSTKQILDHSYADQLEKGIIDEYPTDAYLLATRPSRTRGSPTATTGFDKLQARYLVSVIRKRMSIGNNRDAERIK
jgi:hypothetical protein